MRFDNHARMIAARALYADQLGERDMGVNARDNSSLRVSDGRFITLVRI